MKIAAACMLKDECDIVELFIRINSSWVDHFFVVDNGSSDATPHILRLLSQEGYPITVRSDTSIHYHQNKITTALVREIADRGEYDFVFPIDGDEFVGNADLLKQSLASLAPNQKATIEWTTLIPNDSSVMQATAPLYDGFSRRLTEIRSIRKVILSNQLASVANIEMGNHDATRIDGRAMEEKLLPVPLFHVPVRSKEQIIGKALIGSHKMSIKENRHCGEVFHWDLIAAIIRANGFTLSDEQLRDIALGYSWNVGDPKVRETVSQSLGSKSDARRYSELSNINLPLLLDAFVKQLCGEVILTRSTAPLLRKVLRQLLKS